MATDPADPEYEHLNDTRRSKILSKLRGWGTATRDRIGQVAQSFDKGTVDVIEDFNSYTILIKYIDTTGIPANFTDLEAAVKQILPAHLNVKFFFNFLVWDELDIKTWSWDGLDALKKTWNELEVIS